MDFQNAFKTLDLIRLLASVRGKHRGRRRLLVMELSDNLDLLNLVHQGQVGVDQAIPELKDAVYQKLLEESFSFNTLSRRKIAAANARHVAQLRRYQGWPTERLVDNIYRKIRQLKTLKKLKLCDPAVNYKQRLENLRRLLVLLMVHLNR